MYNNCSPNLRLVKEFDVEFHLDFEGLCLQLLYFRRKNGKKECKLSGTRSDGSNLSRLEKPNNNIWMTCGTSSEITPLFKVFVCYLF